ncbi:hypothetical protein [Streptomyces sp. NPDC086023]|uniref:hypothetical protein n=1 Tax=Streptomyces sp. NPDC086023 TaxID=3365746 RepID=UPI0037D14D4F
MGTDLSLAHGIVRVLQVWQHMTANSEMSHQTFDKFGLLLQRFGRYATVRGALLIADVRSDLVEDFVNAKGHSRHGRVSDPAVATRLLRRSVVRAAYRVLRELGLSDQDPARDIPLPARTHGGVRALTEDEVVALRHHASYSARPTRLAAAAALALAGGHSGEIGHIVAADLDLSLQRVWMHGSIKYEARWCRLDAWSRQVLAERARQVAARHSEPATAHLAVSSRPTSDAALQARACVALGGLLRRIGLGGEPDVKPASITATAAVVAFEATGRIEEAARTLGLRSLDRAAEVIDYDWRCNRAHTDGVPPRA